MKELSIEEKAKAYDEVIKKAESLYKAAEPMSGCNVIIETLFPELKESEDERIRKSITEFFKNFSKNGTYKAIPDVTKWIDWLEKQGKNNMGISEATKKKLEDNLNKALEKETPESWNEFLDRGEQKPANKFEPKFRVGDKIIEKDYDECDCGTIIDIKDGKYIFDDGSFICIEEQGLWQLVAQKPVWSEEDDKMFNKIASHLNATCGGFPEDEKWANKFLDWLKSLKDRYTWKPNDKQMKAIEHICDGNYNVDLDILDLIYRDFKKLREE